MLDDGITVPVVWVLDKVVELAPEKELAVAKFDDSLDSVEDIARLDDRGAVDESVAEVFEVGKPDIFEDAVLSRLVESNSEDPVDKLDV